METLILPANVGVVSTDNDDPLTAVVLKEPNNGDSIFQIFGG